MNEAMFKYSIYACFIGFILDMIFGDPHFKFHPIRLMGKLIEKLEKIFHKIFPDSPTGLTMAGTIFNIAVCAVSAAASFGIIFSGYYINAWLGIAVESGVCYFMLAAKSLKKESMKVYEKICEGDIFAAKESLSMIVGRDTEKLDKKGIIKAAVETVAENLSDGVIAPIFYMLLGGGTAGVLYKAINTMDSMTGYKNEKYFFFGKFSAKLDDAANFIPSRISAVTLIIACFISGKDYKSACRIFKRDRFRHQSPNSGQTESVCAGALNIQLSGDAFYFGRLYKKPFIGDDIRPVRPQDIIDINRLMYLSSFLMMGIFGGGIAGIHIFLGGGLF